MVALTLLLPQVVCDFCHEHLEHNKAAFESAKMELIHDDARAQLEAYPGKFDVIIGDLADPLDGGPCYQLYTQVGALCAAHMTLHLISAGSAGAEVTGALAGSLWKVVVPAGRHLPMCVLQLYQHLLQSGQAC
jgi:hypothetical protein